MRARFATLTILALVCAALAGSASTRASSSPMTRLIDIRPDMAGGRSAVVIEASAPMAYAASRPDPLTVLIDLRAVSAEGARNRLAASTARTSRACGSA
jgi:hypothetical protein